MTTIDNHTLQKPLDAKLVLLVAIFLPGMGQVINNAPKRGFFMACFMPTKVLFNEMKGENK